MGSAIGHTIDLLLHNQVQVDSFGLVSRPSNLVVNIDQVSQAINITQVVDIVLAQVASNFHLKVE